MKTEGLEGLLGTSQAGVSYRPEDREVTNMRPILNALEGVPDLGDTGPFSSFVSGLTGEHEEDPQQRRLLVDVRYGIPVWMSEWFDGCHRIDPGLTIWVIQKMVLERLPQTFHREGFRRAVALDRIMEAEANYRKLSGDLPRGLKDLSEEVIDALKDGSDVDRLLQEAGASVTPNSEQVLLGASTREDPDFRALTAARKLSSETAERFVSADMNRFTNAVEDHLPEITAAFE